MAEVSPQVDPHDDPQWRQAQARGCLHGLLSGLMWYLLFALLGGLLNMTEWGPMASILVMSGSILLGWMACRREYHARLKKLSDGRDQSL